MAMEETEGRHVVDEYMDMNMNGGCGGELWLVVGGTAQQLVCQSSTR